MKKLFQLATIVLAMAAAVVAHTPDTRPVAPGPFPIRTVVSELALRTGSSIEHVERVSTIERICRPVAIAPGRTKNVCQDVTFTSSQSKIVKFCTVVNSNGKKVNRCQSYRLAPVNKPAQPAPIPTPTTPPVIYPDAPAGTYKFTDVDKAGAPIRFEACKVLTWSVGGTDAEIALTREAMNVLEAATGFSIREVPYDGYRPIVDALPASPTSRTGIVIRWAAEGEISDLSGNVAGITQSLWWTLGDRTWRSFSAITIESTNELLTRSGGNTAWPILLHELGHAVGLSHVEDLYQLMYPTTWTGTADNYQQGDLAGLARVGRGNSRCN